MCAALEMAFCKAFFMIFEKGTGIIERSYNKESLGEDYEIQNYAVKVKGTRCQLRRMNTHAQMAGLGNMAAATAEGIDYHLPKERMMILKMMEAAVSKGKKWSRLNTEVDEYMERLPEKEWSDSEIKVQIGRTSRAFAADMLVLKFIQGFPVAGILGGLGNPVYYHKILQYVGMKYQKRYLRALEGGWNADKCQITCAGHCGRGIYGQGQGLPGGFALLGGSGGGIGSIFPICVHSSEYGWQRPLFIYRWPVDSAGGIRNLCKGGDR